MQCRTPCPGVATPRVIWVLMHPSTMKKMPHRLECTLVWPRNLTCPRAYECPHGACRAWVTPKQLWWNLFIQHWQWLPQSQEDGILPSDELPQPAPPGALRLCRIRAEMLTCGWEERLENQGKAQWLSPAPSSKEGMSTVNQTDGDERLRVGTRDLMKMEVGWLRGQHSITNGM